MVGAAGGQQASVGAQGQAFHAAIVRVLETGPGVRSGKREAADRPALKPDHQAAARPIGRKPPDASRLQDRPSFPVHRTRG